MANLGFVGLGVMGGNMVARLLEKGHIVTGYNRTRAKAQWLVDKGMRWADSPRAVAAAADTTFSMVTNTAALQAISSVYYGIIGGLALVVGGVALAAGIGRWRNTAVLRRLSYAAALAGLLVMPVAIVYGRVAAGKFDPLAASAAMEISGREN